MSKSIILFGDNICIGEITADTTKMGGKICSDVLTMLLRIAKLFVTVFTLFEYVCFLINKI